MLKWYGIVEFNVPLDTASIGHFRRDWGPEQWCASPIQ